MRDASYSPPLAGIFHGAAVDVLRQRFAARSVDMVYLDPPFGTQKVWSDKAGSFSDKFAWDADAERRIADLPAHIADIIRALPRRPADKAYLCMMAELLVELRRVLNNTGTLWLHCDDTMGAYLRAVGGIAFGPALDLGQVIWKRHSAHNMRRAWGRVHDTIIVFGRSRASRWRLHRIGSPLVRGDPCKSLCVDGYIDVQLNQRASERVGYPTQKPVALLARIVAAGSLPDDLVLDPTCGSGTTLVAASMLGRQVAGIDQSADAVALTLRRLADSQVAA